MTHSIAIIGAGAGGLIAHVAAITAAGHEVQVITPEAKENPFDRRHDEVFTIKARPIDLSSLVLKTPPVPSSKYIPTKGESRSFKSRWGGNYKRRR